MAQQPPPPATPPSPPVVPTISAGPGTSAPAPAAPGRDWATSAADKIDLYVGAIRDRTTRPAILASRGLVFGLIIAILGVTALVLLWITWITLITALVGEVWITFFITGGIFILVGAFLMAKRHPPEVGF